MTGRRPKLFINGESVSDICKRRGLSYSAVASRVRRGWTAEDALSGTHGGLPKRTENLNGLKFGKLTVLEFSHTSNHGAMWKCKCDCGNEIITRASNLKSGKSKSCGCKRANGEGYKWHTTHGMSGTKLYGVYLSMKNRCCRPATERYKSYGARGIRICDEWMQDAGAFIKWAMENGYREGLQIDRIDVNGNYAPENCRFITPIENAQNKCNTLRLLGGMTVSDFSRTFSLPYERCRKLYKAGNVSKESLLAAAGGAV